MTSERGWFNRCVTGVRKVVGKPLLMLIGFGIGNAGVVVPDGAPAPLPYEEIFADYHKGNWRVAGQSASWRSRRVQIENREGVVVSFDVNRKGDRTSGAGDFLRIWYELDEDGVKHSMWNETGSFTGREVSVVVPAGHRTLRIGIDGRSGDRGLQYLVDNLQVECPRSGEMLRRPTFELMPAVSVPVGDGATREGVTRYSRLPGHVESRTFVVKVNGMRVPVEESWGDPAMVIDPAAVDFKVAVARFAVECSAADVPVIEVGVPEPIVDYAISPRAPSEYGQAGDSIHEDVRVLGNVLRFKLRQARHLMLKVNAHEYLILLIDRPEENPPSLADAEVVTLAEYLPKNRDPHTDVTAALQQAITETAAARRILFVPDGLYRTGQLIFGSYARVYLSSGALVQAIPDWNRDLWPAQAGANETNKDSSFIYVGSPANGGEAPGIKPVDQVHLFGRGVIDGNGWNMRRYNDSSLTTANVKLFRSASASSLTVEDIYFRDSARWSFNILHSKEVRFTNVKLVNCLIGYWGNWTNDQHHNPDISQEDLFHLPLITNSDGFDIDASVDVVMEDGFVFTGDDAFTPKVTGYLDLVAPCREIRIRRNLIWSEKVALKVGPETYADISDVYFHQNHVVRCDRFLSCEVQGKPGVEFAGIHAQENWLEYTGGNAYEQFFRFKLFHSGKIRDVTVDGLYALLAAPEYSLSEGVSMEHDIGPVLLRNIRVGGETLTQRDIFGPATNLKFTTLDLRSDGDLPPSIP